ncbi:MAG: GAF domain-containing protein [Deltaproteobacteria bacterium]|nr:GAF domain-containing protein [Deltaproteobacteria bacterium]
MTESERLRFLSTLHAAGQALHSVLDPEQVLDRILELVHRVFRFDASAVLLLDESGERLAIRASQGYRPEVVASFRGASGQGITGWVLQHRRAVAVPDVRRDPRYVNGVENAASEIAAPLVLEDRVIGVLDAESAVAREFSREEVEYFALFALQAATAIHNAGLHASLARHTEELAARADRLRALNRVAKALGACHDTDVLLERILRKAQETLRFDACAVLLWDEDEAALRIRAARGYPPETMAGFRGRAGVGITGAVLRSGEARLATDVHATPDYVPGIIGGRCEMAVPLLQGTRVFGVLDAESREAGAFGEADLELFCTFASHAAVALQNARLLEELAAKNALLRKNVEEVGVLNRELRERAREISAANTSLQLRLEELSTLNAAGRAITASLDLDETLRSIVGMTGVIVDASASAIKLLEEDGSGLRVRAARGPYVGVVEGGSTGGASGGARIQVPLQVGDHYIGVFEVCSEKADAFSEGDRTLLTTLASQAAIAIENARLYEGTQRTYFETIRALAGALEARDAYTRGHSERVTAYALHLGGALGLSGEALDVVRYAGLLHDIGKIGIPDTVLHKHDALSPEDRRTIETHPQFADSILAPIRFLREALVAVYHHHERWDGTGYPDALRGEAIPLAARIICVADAFDAMTSSRPYRGAMGPGEAVEELQRGAGTQFDPRVVGAFLRVLAAAG